MASATELPNSLTPLAFLPPALANQFEVLRYIYAATLGAYVWDIGLNLGNDYTLLFKHRVRFPTIVYFLSRAFTLAFILTCFIIAVHIGPTLRCINTSVPANIEVSVIVPFINDTAVFLAINYRILAHTIVADSSMDRLRVFFGGTGLSALSRALLQGGQHFYLIAAITHIILLVVLMLSRLTPIYHTMLSIPGLALVNAMACLVFRRIKFGLISSDGTSKIPTIDLPSDVHATANSRSLPLYFRRTDPTTTDLRRTATFPLEVRVQKETHGFEDSADVEQDISKTKDLT
ncbi:hypothetical protein MSAN_02314700 [Mycena sanguinolenta]|uniref:Uncharacterized protein n=1 Tax=Mycena sanguinolenta TaxID=230812 RepID=A0A8H7CG17_9AGAR|nr:hypothetical protein MSAN_02314700 [Mycena sanguinolenta]